MKHTHTILILISVFTTLTFSACDQQPRPTPTKSEKIGWMKIWEEPRRIEGFGSLWMLKARLNDQVRPISVFYSGPEEFLGYKVGDEVEIYSVKNFDDVQMQYAYFVHNWRRP